MKAMFSRFIQLAARFALPAIGFVAVACFSLWLGSKTHMLLRAVGANTNDPVTAFVILGAVFIAMMIGWVIFGASEAPYDPAYGVRRTLATMFDIGLSAFLIGITFAPFSGLPRVDTWVNPDVMKLLVGIFLLAVFVRGLAVDIALRMKKGAQ